MPQVIHEYSTVYTGDLPSPLPSGLSCPGVTPLPLLCRSAAECRRYSQRGCERRLNRPCVPKAGQSLCPPLQDVALCFCSRQVPGSATPAEAADLYPHPSTSSTPPSLEGNCEPWLRPACPQSLLPLPGSQRPPPILCRLSPMSGLARVYHGHPAARAGWAGAPARPGPLRADPGSPLPSFLLYPLQWGRCSMLDSQVASPRGHGGRTCPPEGPFISMCPLTPPPLLPRCPHASANCRKNTRSE